MTPPPATTPPAAERDKSNLLPRSEREQNERSRKNTVVLLSMTGFGDARGQNDRLSMSVEVRAVNNRYFKLVTKTPERYQALEGGDRARRARIDLPRHGERLGPRRRQWPAQWPTGSTRRS